MKQKPDTVIIQTPEHFELQFQLAGLGSRSVAYIVDRSIQLGFLFVLVLVLLLINRVLPFRNSLSEWVGYASHRIGPWLWAILILIYALATTGYFMLFEYIWSGSTPGKRIFDVRVIRKDGRPITFVDSAIRNIVRFGDVLGDVYPIGLVCMFIDAKHRRLGDFVAGTLVVIDTSANPPEDIRFGEEEDLQEMEFRAVVADMTPADYRLTATFLARRNSLEPEARGDLATRIYVRLLKQSADASLRPAEAEQVLEQLAAGYRQATRIL